MTTLEKKPGKEITTRSRKTAEKLIKKREEDEKDEAKICSSGHKYKSFE